MKQTDLTMAQSFPDDIVRTELDHDVITARAHELWELRGCPIGSPEVDWLEAEAELNARTQPARQWQAA